MLQRFVFPNPAPISTNRNPPSDDWNPPTQNPEDSRSSPYALCYARIIKRVKQRGLPVPTIIQEPPAPTNENGIDLVAVYRQLIRIVARLESTPYTESIQRQTDEVELDDLANPASDNDTSQG